MRYAANDGAHPAPAFEQFDIMRKFVVCSLMFGVVAALTAAEAPAAYQNDFEKAAVGTVPEDMLVLDGAFGTAEGGGNKFLELPGSPLETYGVMFGPTAAHGLSVQARIRGTGQGRRSPVFGIGLNGVAGYRLRVSPAKKALEICKGDDVVTSATYAWESGSWTVLKLEFAKVKEGEFAVRGKAWKDGTKEPAEWSVQSTATAELPPGRPSLWGSPYSGTPIQFDDLRVIAAAPSN
jgi:hypothetical protein